MLWIIIALIAICLVTGALAARKGYNFLLWIGAGNIIGLVILSFLPFANAPELSVIEQQEKTKTGNIIGGVLTAIAISQMLFRLLFGA